MSLDTSKMALRVNRRNMAVFIKADAITVSLERRQKVETAAGGYTRGPVQTLAPQQFRLVPFKRRLYDFTQATTSGNPQVEDYVLVGRHTADIRRDDEFTYNGDRYRVDSVEPKEEDRTKTDRVVVKITIEVADKAKPVAI